MMNRKRYKSVPEIICKAADLLKPPERLTTTQAAAKYVYLDVPGQYTGYYDPDKTPYMTEPADNLQSREFTSEIFVGPAQSGKTQSLIVNWVGTTVMTRPMDMIIYSPSQANARDFSARRIDRLHDKSETGGQKSEIGKRLLKSRDADNKTDKKYNNGMILTLSWPTKNEMAGKPVGLIAITDYDRITDDVDGDGSAFSLASKRTTTFLSFAMTLAESSPSREITDNKWIRRTPHEAPPCGGILGLYNAGDRRRWYWPCPHCGNYFVGSFRMLEWDTHENTITASETARMRCPNIACNVLIHPDYRYDMNLKGRWLADGQSIDKDGTIYGEAVRSKSVSYWLDGTAAYFISWAGLVAIKIEADKDYDRTGDEGSLRKFYNNDLAEPYVPKSIESVRQPETLMTRAETMGGTREMPKVPDGVRFLVASVDVQKNMFVVQVHGIGPGDPFDITIIDRFNIHLNVKGRKDDDGQIAWIKPGTYLEDWEQIETLVIDRAYELADGSGRKMTVKLTVCDSGGKAGVTSNAYEYFRSLRREGRGGRFHLVKGTGTPGAPRARITFPDSNNTGDKAAAQGDVPVLMLNSNSLKDSLNNRLDSLVPGKGMIRFPDYLPDWFYRELCAEFRTEKGWEHPKGERNEAWDLLYYAIGACISPLLAVEGYDWTKPPAWAAIWDKNPFVIANEAKQAFAIVPVTAIDFSKHAQALA